MKDYIQYKFIYLGFNMKIYSPPGNHIIAKINFTAQLANNRLEHQVVSYAHKHKQFQDQHPLFSVPALQTEQHQFYFGTHSIMRKLAPKNHFLSPFQQAQVNQWLQLIETDFQSSVGVLILRNNDLTQIKQQQQKKAKQSVLNFAKLLEERLKMRTFLVGNSITIADISAYFSWNQIKDSLQQESKTLVCVARWCKQISSLPFK